MNNSPLISVIMATYNHARFVVQAMQSVLNQKEVAIEFLIADDGSADNTAEVVASVNDPRIKFFPNAINRGACIVTNELINNAQGDYIALINSDDYWTDDYKLKTQLQYLEDNPKYGACFGWARFVDNEGKVIPKDSLSFGRCFEHDNKSQGKWLRHFFDFGNCICHPTMLIRKTCYEELGTYNNRLRQLPDLDMWVRLLKKHNIYIFKQEFINFRILPGENASSQTTDNSIRTMNEHSLIAETFFEDLSREILIDGFGDQLICKDIPTSSHLEIEKTLLFFKDNASLGKPYKMIGLSKMYQLLNNPKHQAILLKDYQIDDKWFQRMSAQIDVLRPRILAQLSQRRFFLKSIIHCFRDVMRNALGVVCLKK